MPYVLFAAYLRPSHLTPCVVGHAFVVAEHLICSEMDLEVNVCIHVMAWLDVVDLQIRLLLDQNADVNARDKDGQYY